jgi:hypothetical protein
MMEANNERARKATANLDEVEHGPGNGEKILAAPSEPPPGGRSAHVHDGLEVRTPNGPEVGTRSLVNDIGSATSICLLS